MPHRQRLFPYLGELLRALPAVDPLLPELMARADELVCLVAPTHAPRVGLVLLPLPLLLLVWLLWLSFWLLSLLLL